MRKTHPSWGFCCSKVTVLFLAAYLNTGSIPGTRLGDNVLARPHSGFAKRWMRGYWLQSYHLGFPLWIVSAAAEMTGWLSLISTKTGLQIGPAFLYRPLEGRSTRPVIILPPLCVTQWASESHFVNRSDVWLSPFELMSDELLSPTNKTPFFPVLTWAGVG